MPHGWKTTILTSVAEALHVFAGLRGKRWLCRGQSKRYGGLMPSIDRRPRRDLSRLNKLTLERRSIDLFRSTARFFAGRGEEGALADDIVALMVLRHYGVPTRLLDWSMSPYVAAYFAVCGHDTEDGEIWSFDEPLYEQEGKKQWRRWPETTNDGTGDPDKFIAGLTACSLEEPPDWFICGFYTGFPRQDAQAGVYTMTSRFGCDHSAAIAGVLAYQSNHYHVYAVRADLKPTLRKILQEEYGVWRGSLFPDSAGAAATTLQTVFPRD